MSIVPRAIGAVVATTGVSVPDASIPGSTPDPLMYRKHGLIGAPMSRLDGPIKVQGQARFAAEFPMQGMVYAALAYSTIPRGRIATIDTRAAEAEPGVVLVMTHENAPRMKPMPVLGSALKALGGDDLPMMQDDEIHWNGQPIALVLAETQEQADHAKSLIRVTYNAEPATTSFESARAKITKPGKYQGEFLKLEIGDAEAALAAAPHQIDVTYRTPRHNHNAIELHAVTLAWNENKLTIHDATQAVVHMAWSMAQIFGIDEKDIHVTSPYVGGSFGGKALWPHQVLAAAASKLAGRPVRIMLSREGVYRVVGGRTLTEQRVALGAQDDGRFDALIHTGLVATTEHSNMPEPFIQSTLSNYEAGSFKLGVETTPLDMVSNTFMRGPGEAVGSFGLESGIDELAHAMQMDPIALRIRNEPEKDPTSGAPFSSRHLVEAYRAGAERFGWDQRSATPSTRREGEWLIGMGCATAAYPYNRLPGGAARITLTKDGHVKVEIAAHEMGMGTVTAQTQVTAERLGVPMDKVQFCYGDSNLPGVVLAAGSQQTASIGAAVIAAQQELIAELLKLVGEQSPLYGLKVDEVTCYDSGLAKLAKLAKLDHCETYTAILAQAGRDDLVVEANAPPPTEGKHWSMHSYGAMFCEVRVNKITGETRVSRFLGSFDCGRILNSKTAASQFRGGIVMGLGFALTEETQFDERNGRIMNPSLAEYHVPVHMDVPEIDVMWTDIPDPHSPMGARGVGEIGITGVGAAVANAIFNACGKRVRSLPITLDKLMT